MKTWRSHLAERWPRGFVSQLPERFCFPYFCCWPNLLTASVGNGGRNCFFRLHLKGGLSKTAEPGPEYQFCS